MANEVSLVKLNILSVTNDEKMKDKAVDIRVLIILHLLICNIYKNDSLKFKASTNVN